MLRSPHGLAGVVGLVVLAQHHLRLVLQGLHVLRILQAPRFWKGAAAVSSSPACTALTDSQDPGRVCSACTLSSCPQGRSLQTSGSMWIDEGKVIARRKSLEFPFFIPNHFSGWTKT